MTPAPHRDDEIAAAIDNAWIAELTSAWDRCNVEMLDGALRRPALILLDGDSTLGQWNPERRTIGISRSHIAESSWCAVMETLRHEMAHQLVDETMPLARGETQHGPSFRIACARLRIDHAASAGVTQRSAADHAEDSTRLRLIRRLEKLLSLAASPNENEANAAFEKARRLMLEHEVDDAALQSGSDGPRQFAVRDLGPIKARHQAWEFVLANILDDYFFVDIIWAHAFDAPRCKKGTVVRAYGAPHHLDFAEHVYAFLTGVLDSLWLDYRRRNQLRGNRERQRYFHGLLLGFKKTLARQDAQIAVSHPGLVVVENAALRAFFRRHHPNIRTISRGRTRRGGALDDGQRDGRAIRIHRPVGGGGESTFGGLLE